MLNDVKTLLGIKGDDRDELLELIISTSQSRLCLLINEASVPIDLEYIVTEVAVRRFNRIASEGLSAHTVEGESLTWSTDDFEEFKDDIQAWLDAHADGTGKGKVRFI